MAYKKLNTEIRVGIFVSLGVLLIMLSIVLLDENHSFFGGKNSYQTHFPKVDGLITGSKVMLNGVSVGVVEQILPDPVEQSIVVHFSIHKKFAEWIRTGSTVEIATQGILGDKYISLTPGGVREAFLPPHSEIPNVPPKDFSELISKSDHLILSFNQLALRLDQILQSFQQQTRKSAPFLDMSRTLANLAQITDTLKQAPESLSHAAVHLEQILKKVNEGTGSIGALINDPILYDDIKSLLGGVNRNRIIRNLVRKTIQENTPTNSISDSKK